MFPFIVSAGFMTLFALVLLLPGLWRERESLDEENEIQDEANVSITREQLAQLKEAFAAGQISQTEFDTHRAELETALARSLASTARVTRQSGGRITAIALAVLVPLSAAWLYQKLGKPQMLDPDFVQAAQQSSETPSAEKLPSIDELLPQLTAHLEENPGDARGWRLLGTTYLRLQRFVDADQALSKAYALNEGDADLMLQLADAKAMVANGQLEGEPQALVEKALLQRPDDVRGNWMLGIAYQQQGKPAEAVAVWEPLLAALGNAPEARADLQKLIDDTRGAGVTNNTDSTLDDTGSGDRLATQDTATPAVTVDGSEGDTGSVADNQEQGAVTVRVVTDPSVVLPADASVFIYAKAAQGPPMPLAAVRKQVSELPVEVVLNDALAMIPTLKLSGFERVVVGARVSRSGNPVASEGDIYGEVAGVSVGQSDAVVIVLSEIVGASTGDN